MLRLLPSLHLFKVHEDSLSSGVVVHDEDRTFLPLNAGKNLMLTHLVIRRQRILDLGNQLVRILDPDHGPGPLDFERVAHRGVELKGKRRLLFGVRLNGVLAFSIKYSELRVLGNMVEVAIIVKQVDIVLHGN